MVVIAEYTVAGDDFVFGRAATPEVDVELERLDPDDDDAVGYFWVEGDADRFEASLSADPVVDGYRVIDDFAGRRFYRGGLDPDGESLVAGLTRFRAAVLGAVGDHEEWEFRVGFDDDDALSGFQSYCVDTADLDFELDRLYGPVEVSVGARAELTPRQRETLITAYREGYFDIPRKITLVDLAEELSVSDQAVSERLRRGESKLVCNYLLED
jgi:hypothetical protein